MRYVLNILATLAFLAISSTATLADEVQCHTANEPSSDMVRLITEQYPELTETSVHSMAQSFERSIVLRARMEDDSLSHVERVLATELYSITLDVIRWQLQTYAVLEGAEYVIEWFHTEEEAGLRFASDQLRSEAQTVVSELISLSIWITDLSDQSMQLYVDHAVAIGQNTRTGNVQMFIQALHQANCRGRAHLDLLTAVSHQLIDILLFVETNRLRY